MSILSRIYSDVGYEQTHSWCNVAKSGRTSVRVSAASPALLPYLFLQTLL